MKILIQKNELQRELEFVKPATVGNIESFKTVRLEARDGGVTLQAHNGNIAVRSTAKASVSEHGIADVRCGVALDIVKSLATADLVLRTDAGNLVIEQGDYVCRLQRALDYVAPEEPTSAVTIALDGKVLRGLLDASIHAVAKQDVPNLSACVLLEFTPGRLRAVATDGHRLSLGTLQALDRSDSFNIYVPYASLDIVRSFVNDIDVVTMHVAERRLVLEGGNRRIVTGLLWPGNVQFPPYEKILVQPHTGWFLVDRDSLVAAVKRTSIMSVRTHRQVALNVGSDELRVVVDSAEEGSTAGETVTIQRDSTAPARIRVNAVYLLDAIIAAPEGDLLFKFGSDSVPMLITPGESTSIETTSLVMPLKEKK